VRGVLQYLADQNLFASTLAPPGTFLSQFINFDWTTPWRNLRTAPFEMPSNLSLSTLAPVGTFPEPFANEDWIVSPISRQRYGPYQDMNNLLGILFQLAQEPYWEAVTKLRPFEFDPKKRVMKFPAKDRRFTLE
jgi:hypothetical protein